MRIQSRRNDDVGGGYAGVMVRVRMRTTVKDGEVTEVMMDVDDGGLCRYASSVQSNSVMSAAPTPRGGQVLEGWGFWWCC